MKRTVSLLISLILCFVLMMPALALAEATVPSELPADLGGKTLYGYLMDLKSQYIPSRVFQDAVQYTDLDRENARAAAKLIVDATTRKMEEAGQPDQYMLYLRAYAYDLQYRDQGDAAMKAAGLADYQKTVELGGSYAQADYDKLVALEIAAAPLTWQMPQMLTLKEIGALLGVAEGDLIYVQSAYPTGDGSRQGVGYTLRSAQDPAACTIFVLADPQGGQTRYELLKSHAFLRNTTDVAGVGDEAVCLGLRNMDNNSALYTTVLAWKDQLVLQVRVPYAVWHGAGFDADPAQLAQAIAAQVLQNLYDTQRTVPSMEGIVAENLIAQTTLNPGTPDSPVPDAIPADLGGKTTYGYLVEIRQAYLPESVYSNAELSQSDLNNARRAARLMADTLTKGFDSYGFNPYELEIRASCYAFAYQDTGNAVFRKLAINDYKQALYTGYWLAKTGYDQLASPLLAPMSELSLGATGDSVMLLQQWLIQINYMEGSPTATFDEATRQAVELYEQENSLTPDGIADTAFLLSLYSRIDDGDAVLPGE
ncbi:MAG: peptidoglycan-binding protein [Eubacteriales bacterium]|nr:peptidoglycan-binding protein [Eubacteriales bacterium]